MMSTKPEVLAPAGDFDRLKAALLFGADAVYLGAKEFGMRAAPQNFDDEQMQAACRLAHQNGAKVYLTCNTLPRNAEIERLPQFFKTALHNGVDALIVADIGVLKLAKRCVPEMDIHISTQAGVVNYLAANELHAMGASRVVLARELCLDEIKQIRDKTPPELEIETFVHGAMCVSFSGRCLLSSFLTNRDANRGACAQPCRWKYHLVEEKRPGEYFPIEEGDAGTHILNARDLCMIEHIDQLIDAGITSLKIEGRAKSDYYVATITNAYRMAVDGCLKHGPGYTTPQWLCDEVRKVSHREYSTGFYFGPPQNGQIYDNGGYVRQYDIVAVVDNWHDGRAYCTQKNRFSNGDAVEVLEPVSKPFALQIKDLTDEQGQAITVAPHPMMKVSFACESPIKAGSIVRKANLPTNP